MLRHSIESIVKNDDSANNKSPSSTSSSPRLDDCSPPPPSTASSGGYSGGPDYITSNFQNVFQSHILSAVSHPHTSRLSGADNSMQWFAQLCQREFEQFNQSIIQSGAGGYIANGVDQPTGLFVQPYRKPKRIRTAFNPHQLAQLELAFDSNHYVIGGERKVLAKRLDLSETQVKVWFQNRRTKAKRVKTETSSTVAADK